MQKLETLAGHGRTRRCFKENKMKCFECKKELKEGEGTQYAPGKTPEGQQPMLLCDECVEKEPYKDAV